MKLARELSKRQTGRTLYLLDEPTTGLHFDDVRKLLEVLHRLTDLGNTIIIIEHNLDVIRNADWILDLGPEGGEDGGRVVGQGRPAKIAATPGSYTGQFLKRYYTSSNGRLEPAEPDEQSDLGAPSFRRFSGERVGNHESESETAGQESENPVSRNSTTTIKTTSKKYSPRRKKTVLP
jgi:excinuclease ABC subunit A